jgi:hypothetical protein
LVSDSTKSLIKGSKLSVVSSDDGTTDALFEVKRKDGQTVFAVYPDAVNIYIPQGIKGTKGGFAIGGFDGSKTSPQDYFRVTRDSVRIYIDQTPKTVKGATKGGFAIGGFDQSKSSIAVQDLLTVSNDSIRMYINKNPTIKGATKGGFAIGGFGVGKTDPSFYLNMTPLNYFIGEGSGKLTSGLYNSYLGYETGILTSTGEKNVFIGYHSGMNNKNASFNVFLGNETGQVNEGDYNSFIGYRAGYNNKSGYQNCFMGYEAGLNNLGGNTNVFVGYHAGYNNKSGANNVFLGTVSGSDNEGGGGNTFIGFGSGLSNKEGGTNTFIGSYAGASNNTDFNTFIGYSSGYSNVDGKENIFLGYYAGYNNVTGKGNTLIGSQAGEAYTGNNLNYNVFLGDKSGRFNHGDDNVFLGYASGYNCQGNGNVLIGKNAGQQSVGNNKLFIENSLDLATPLIYGEFDNKKLRFNAKVGINTDASSIRLSSVDDIASDDTPAIQGQHNVTSYYGIGVKGIGGWIGARGESTITGGTGERCGLFGTASGGATNYGVYGEASGGIAYAGYFSGDVYVSGTFLNPSDKSLKKNVLPLTGSLIKVLSLQGVTYEWKSESELESIIQRNKGDKKGSVSQQYNFPIGVQLGIIAQDVEKILPELVHTDADGLKSVDYIKIIPLLIEATKEQQQQIESAMLENLQLKSELQVIKGKLEEIEAALAKGSSK